MSEIYKKFISSIGIQIISRGLSVIVGVLMARWLGPHEFGLYSFVMSIISLATIPVLAGLPQLLVREVANAELENRWGEIKGILIYTTIYIALMSIVVVIFFNILLYVNILEIENNNIFIVALLLIPCRGFLGNLSAFLNGLRSPVLSKLPSDIVVPVILISSMLVYSFCIGIVDAELIIMFQVGALLFAILISVIMVKIKLPAKISSEKTKFEIYKWLANLVPFSMMAIVSMFNLELASVLLGILDSNDSVGYFKVSMQGVNLLALGLYSINIVIGPNVARLYRAGDLEETQKLLSKSVRISAFISIPPALMLIFYGDYIVLKIFGEAYLPAATALGILCIGQLVNVLMGSVGLVLNMTGNEKKSLRSLFVAFVVNLGLLVYLIPMHQEVGAAIAVSLSLALWNIIMAIDVFRIAKLKTWIWFN